MENYFQYMTCNCYWKKKILKKNKETTETETLCKNNIHSSEIMKTFNFILNIYDYLSVNLTQEKDEIIPDIKFMIVK